MLLPRSVVRKLSAGLMLLGAGVVSGQTTSTGSRQAYPNKPIRIVTGEAGGGNDFQVRLIAQGLTGSLGQPVIVDNRGILAGELVAKAPPDGYTLLFYGPAIWLLPFMQDKVPYDPVRDFSTVTLAVSSPLVLVVYPSLPVKSVKELIALVKARPGDLNYASGSTGSSAHLAAELFKAMAGVDIVRIPYKGTGPALNALIAGQVQLMFSTAGGVVPHVKSGRLRALAVTSAQPSALVPGLPTVAAAVPDFESTAIAGMFAPARTPATLINRLNQEIVRILNRVEVKEKLFNSGVEVVGSSPERLAATVQSEMTKFSKVIKAAGKRDE